MPMYVIISLSKVNASAASEYAEDPTVDADDGLGGTAGEQTERRVRRRIKHLQKKLMYPRGFRVRVNGEKTKAVFEFARELSPANVAKIEALMPTGIEFRVFDTAAEVRAVMDADPTWLEDGGD